MNWTTNPFILTLLSGLLGAILGSFISSACTYFIMKKEKKYFIEIELISDKILNPLFIITEELIKREQTFNRLEGIVTNEICSKINAILCQNLCWIFCSSNQIKPMLYNIKKYAQQNEHNKLLAELKKLYSETETKLSKYA